jgi:glucose/arabinose dehydrogenase
VGAVLFFISLAINIITVYPIQASPESGLQAGNKFYFICDPYNDEKFTCYPSKTNVVGSLINGSSRKIYSVSSLEADFSRDRNITGLNMHALLGEYVTINKSDKFNFHNFSISFWIKRVDWFDSYAPVLSFINSDSTAGWIFDLREDGSSIRFGVTNNEGKISFSANVHLDLNSYVNIVGTFDGSKIRIYRNGILASETAYSGQYNPDPGLKMRIGLDSFDNENSWAGGISDLKIFDRALQEREVKSLHIGKNDAINGLVGHWPFNGNLNDISGNYNDASLRMQAVSMITAPDGRIFFSEKKTGQIRIISNDKVLERPFVKLSGLYSGDHEGLLGVAIDPKFSNNHYIYAYATYEDPETGKPFNEVLRLTDKNNSAINVTPLLERIPADPEGNYAGGALTFGPDDKLYVTVGMGPRPTDSQNITSVLGKVLRINRDGTIPDDNPIVNSPVYTSGHRNMFGIAFDKNGDGLVTENGDTHFDELNLLRKGGNYGFPFMQYPTVSSIRTNSNLIQPLREYDRVIAPAQAIFYTGNKYPELTGRFVVASYNDGNLRAIRLNQTDGQMLVDDLALDFNQSTPENLVAVTQSSSGDIYFAGYNIYKVESLSSQRKLVTFSVETTVSLGVEIEQMTIFRENSSLEFHVKNNVRSPQLQKAVIELKLPENLISGFESLIAMSTSEKYTGYQNTSSSAVTYRIDSDVKNNTNLITINLNKTGNFTIFASGTQTLAN